MRHPATASTIILALLVLPALAVAQLPAAAPGGQVEIPLEVYNRLIEAARNPERPARPAPSPYVLGQAQVRLQVAGGDARTADVKVSLVVRILDDDWVLVPLLPPGTAVITATADGAGVELLATPSGLGWGTKGAGQHTVDLHYQVDAARSADGWSLPLPVPAAAALRLVATLPGQGLDVAVIPAAGVTTTSGGANTEVTATLPATRGVQISWRAAAGQELAVSRARYRGTLQGRAVVWNGELDVELFADSSATLLLLPRGTTLAAVTVDGKSAPILTQGGRFATMVRGRGSHTVGIGFESGLAAAEGPPQVVVAVPEVPVSSFELTLPGRKEVTVTPSSNVVVRPRGESTVASAYVPLTSQVTFRWTEAVPEAVEREVVANAGVYHAVHAEEGVLGVRALVDYEVSRGETKVIRLAVPAEVEVNRVSSPQGSVADWRLAATDGGQEITVFLDLALRGHLLLDIEYDRALAPPAEAEPVTVPLLEALGVQRQRGMVALLASKDLTLEPVEDGGATRVGENQLPPFVRQAVEMTVAHTFKYTMATEAGAAPPRLVARVSVPERKEGRYDAAVDTLVSLGDVTLKGAASVELDVKSGSVMALALSLPPGVSLLSLSGPSLRHHEVVAEDGGGQRIDVDFTQEMDGQFRLEAVYEQILGEPGELVVPLVRVRGAEVEEGRLAVEALSAVEVQAATAEQLTALEISELPQQLVLRTTNPILLAYKYVQTEPPPRLVLEVSHHRVLSVQEAAIDRADVRTLFTADGLAVTTARYWVRNSRKQFVKVRLPPGFDVWSAFVDGRPEKPAVEEGEGAGSAVLLKLESSTEGFPVELVYRSPAAPIHGLGRVAATLPHPDILATQTRWDVYLPAEVTYGEVETDMKVVVAGERVEGEAMGAAATIEADTPARRAVEPLRLTVPAAGVHYAFEKLYANQGVTPASFHLPYASGFGRTVGYLLVGCGALLLWAGLAVLRLRPVGVPRGAGWGAAAVGLLILSVAIGWYRVSVGPALLVTLLLVAGGLLWRFRRGATTPAGSRGTTS